MSQKCKLFGMLTTPQAELLKTLYELEQKKQPGRFWRPKELGAYRSSHHSLTLRKLCEQGLVEREQVSRNFAYRIADAGESLWEMVRATSELPSAAFLGGSAVATRARQLLRLHPSRT